MEQTVKSFMKLFGGTAEELSLANLRIPDKTMVYETDTNKIKIGDGVNNYNDLPYTNANALSDEEYAQIVNYNNGNGFVLLEENIYPEIKTSDIVYDKNTDLPPPTIRRLHTFVSTTQGHFMLSDNKAGVYEYDAINNEWIRVADPLTDEQGNILEVFGAVAVTALDDKIYLLGGTDTIYPEHIICFDTTNYTWEVISESKINSSIGNDTYAICAYDNKIYVYGFTDLKIRYFDLSEKRWYIAGDNEHDIVEGATVNIGTKLYTIAPRCTAGRLSTKSVYIFDTSSGTWSVGSDFGGIRFANCAVHDGYIYASDGINLIKFDPATELWEDVTVIAENPDNVIMGFVREGDDLYIIVSDTLYKVPMTTGGTSTTIGKMANYISCMSSTKVSNEIYILTDEDKLRVYDTVNDTFSDKLMPTTSGRVTDGSVVTVNDTLYMVLSFDDNTTALYTPASGFGWEKHDSFTTDEYNSAVSLDNKIYTLTTTGLFIYDPVTESGSYHSEPVPVTIGTLITLGTTLYGLSSTELYKFDEATGWSLSIDIDYYKANDQIIGVSDTQLLKVNESTNIWEIHNVSTGEIALLNKVKFKGFGTDTIVEDNFMHCIDFDPNTNTVTLIGQGRYNTVEEVGTFTLGIHSVELENIIKTEIDRSFLPTSIFDKYITVSSLAERDNIPLDERDKLVMVVTEDMSSGEVSAQAVYVWKEDTSEWLKIMSTGEDTSMFFNELYDTLDDITDGAAFVKMTWAERDTIKGMLQGDDIYVVNPQNI